LKTIEDLLAAAVDTYGKSADDLTKTLSAIDTKAQGTAAVCGALLAALLTVTGRDSFGLAVRIAQRFVSYSVGGAVVLLCLGLLASIWATALVKVPFPYLSDEMARGIGDMRRLRPEERPSEMIENYYSDVLNASLETASAMRGALEKKTRRLRLAQVFAFLGALFVSAVVAVVILVQI